MSFELGEEIVGDVFFAMSRAMKKKILSPYEGESNHRPSDSACDMTKKKIYIYICLSQRSNFLNFLLLTVEISGLSLYSVSQALSFPNISCIVGKHIQMVGSEENSRGKRNDI